MFVQLFQSDHFEFSTFNDKLYVWQEQNYIKMCDIQCL